MRPARGSLDSEPAPPDDFADPPAPAYAPLGSYFGSGFASRRAQTQPQLPLFFP